MECSYQELPIFAKHYVNTNRIHISNDPHDVEADDKDVDEQGPDREDPTNGEYYAWLGRKHSPSTRELGRRISIYIGQLQR